MSVHEKLIPVVCVVFFISFGQLCFIVQRRFEVQFQFLKLLIEFSSSLVFYFCVVLIAFDHFSFGFAYNFLEDLLQHLLFVLFFRFDWTCVALDLWRFGYLLVNFFDWLIGVEEIQQFGEFFKIDCFEEGVIVVFELFFSFLDEGFVSAAE